MKHMWTSFTVFVLDLFKYSEKSLINNGELAVEPDGFMYSFEGVPCWMEFREG